MHESYYAIEERREGETYRDSDRVTGMRGETRGRYERERGTDMTKRRKRSFSRDGERTLASRGLDS
jgi:hypothetical protein